MRWFERQAREWGPLGASLFALSVALVTAAIILGGPKAVDIATPSGPGIPPELADHQERAGLERGQALGAEAATPLPTPESYLGTLGIPYASYPSPNWSGRNGCAIQGIVVHVTGPGSMAGMRSWFKNPTSQVSAHFGIGKDGEIEQYVPIEDAAWQAGIINRPNTANPMIAGWVNEGVNPNRCTVGIETLLGGPAEPLTDYPKMESSLVLLLRWLTQTFNIPADRVHIIGHNEIDSINRATDPVCCIDMAALVKEVAQPQATSSAVQCDADPCFDGANFRFSTDWVYVPNTDQWFDPKGRLYWEARAPWGGRHSPVLKEWMNAGTPYFGDDLGVWNLVP